MTKPTKQIHSTNQSASKYVESKEKLSKDQYLPLDINDWSMKTKPIIPSLGHKSSVDNET